MLRYTWELDEENEAITHCPFTVVLCKDDISYCGLQKEPCEGILCARPSFCLIEDDEQVRRQKDNTTWLQFAWMCWSGYYFFDCLSRKMWVGMAFSALLFVTLAYYFRKGLKR